MARLYSMWGGWDRRFFVCQDIGLVYYTTEVDMMGTSYLEKPPGGIIPIRPDTHVEQVSERLGTDHTFEISVGDRTFVMQAANQQDMMEWLYALGEAKRTANTYTPEPPPREEELLGIFHELVDDLGLDQEERLAAHAFVCSPANVPVLNGGLDWMQGGA